MRPVKRSQSSRERGTRQVKSLIRRNYSKRLGMPQPQEPEPIQVPQRALSADVMRESAVDR